eukprot:TRINITY_DN78846_c0_g1_i1.p1 TRINITY_DN78846_c0_g1~~TRINITY_DN78846_c0_g1_i1.p1  ORF type:complete len:680 (-),score=153.86 TRINITY_DN78846_c0_g1_i1:127-2166(-)
MRSATPATVPVVTVELGSGGRKASTSSAASAAAGSRRTKTPVNVRASSASALNRHQFSEASRGQGFGGCGLGQGVADAQRRLGLRGPAQQLPRSRSGSGTSVSLKGSRSAAGTIPKPSDVGVNIGTSTSCAHTGVVGVVADAGDGADGGGHISTRAVAAGRGHLPVDLTSRPGAATAGGAMVAGATSGSVDGNNVAGVACATTTAIATATASAEVTKKLKKSLSSEDRSFTPRTPTQPVVLVAKSRLSGSLASGSETRRKSQERRGRRPVSVQGISGRAPSIAERSEAWLAQRDQKRELLREKCEAECCFTPRLCRPERSPRWIEGPEGGGDLHERGMRSLARKQRAQRRWEEAILEKELRQCPFRPDVRSSLASASKAAVVENPPANAIKASPAGVRSYVTPESAAAFYGRQLAWMEAKTQEKLKKQEEKTLQILLEESEARKPSSCLSSTGRESRQVSVAKTSEDMPSGILPCTVYDRQMLWLRQRDLELEELRAAQLEELSGFRSQRPPRPRSEPATPRRWHADAADDDFEGPLQRKAVGAKTFRYYRRPPPWQSSTASESGSSPCASPRTPPSEAAWAAATYAESGISGAEIVNQLRSARQQHRPANPKGKSRSAPSTPRGTGAWQRRSSCDRDRDEGNVKGSRNRSNASSPRATSDIRHYDLLDHTADFGWGDQ